MFAIRRSALVFSTTASSARRSENSDARASTATRPASTSSPPFHVSQGAPPTFPCYSFLVLWFVLVSLVPRFFDVVSSRTVAPGLVVLHASSRCFRSSICRVVERIRRVHGALGCTCRTTCNEDVCESRRTKPNEATDPSRATRQPDAQEKYICRGG